MKYFVAGSTVQTDAESVSNATRPKNSEKRWPSNSKIQENNFLVKSNSTKVIFLAGTKKSGIKVPLGKGAVFFGLVKHREKVRTQIILDAKSDVFILIITKKLNLTALFLPILSQDKYLGRF